MQLISTWFKLICMNYFLMISLIFVFSCNKELKYTKEDLFAKAKAADPSTTFILPKSMNEGPNCRDYTDGCLATHIVQIKNLDLIAVEFLTEEQAKYAAKKVRGFYVRNWMLDDVAGEPALEKFVTESLEAKKP